MISNRWKILLAALPIIGTLAIAQPQPGGLGGFYQAWWGKTQLPVPAPTDYLHYWNLSANLNANDDAGNMNGATVGGSYTTNGFVQPAGASYITFGGPITNSTTAYTISIWANPDTIAMADNANGGWLLNDREASSNLDFQISYSTSLSQWRAFFWIGGTATGVGSTNVSNGVWHHLVMAVDSNLGVLQLYVNGALNSSTNFVGSPNNASTVAARTGNGAWSLTANFQFEGIQDKIRFYNRRLSQSEITAIYELEKEEKGIP